MRHIPANEIKATIGKHMLADGYDMALDLRKSHGRYIHDAATGKEYLDLFSFFASAPLGFNHPSMTTPEWKNHIAEVAINKPSNSDFYTEEMAVFVDTFATTVIPDSHPYLFFVAGGALAVENALKTAFDWKVRKNIEAGRGDKLGSKVIHYKKAFHGRTGYTLSLTNTADPRKYMYFPQFDWPRVDPPAMIFPIQENLDAVIAAEEASLKQIDAAIKEHGHDIACLLIEPIQGEGGDNHFRTEYLQALRDRADKHEFLLVFDEVQSGMGMTGEWWAWQAIGVEPDVFCFGKKSQVCGIASNRRVDEVKDNVFHESSRINSTWGGNLVDMVRCTKYLEIMVEENILENVRARHDQVIQGLEALAAKFPGKIANIRGRGLMIAFDMENTELRNALLGKIFDNGAIILPCGHVTVRFRPPMNITAEEVEKAMVIIEKSLTELF